jgi:hypothetical protein
MSAEGIENEERTIETYAWIGSAALLGLLAALVFALVLSKAVNLKPKE